MISKIREGGEPIFGFKRKLYYLVDALPLSPEHLVNLDPDAPTSHVINLPSASDLPKAVAEEKKSRGKAIQKKQQQVKSKLALTSILADEEEKEEGYTMQGV